MAPGLCPLWVGHGEPLGLVGLKVQVAGCRLQIADCRLQICAPLSIYSASVHCLLLCQTATCWPIYQCGQHSDPLGANMGQHQGQIYGTGEWLEPTAVNQH